MDEFRPGTWRLANSIATELDIGLWLVRAAPHKLPKATTDLRASIPEVWLDELTEIMGPPAGLFYPVEILSRWAGVMLEDSYEVATLAMRELTVDDAIERSAAMASLVPDESLPPLERLADLERRMEAELIEKSGLPAPSDGALARRQAEVVDVASRALRGQELHGRFWHWLDRFYYNAYDAWREAARPLMDAERQRAIAELGGESGTGVPPLDWLDQTHPLRQFEGFRDLIESGRTELVFWVEPLGVPTLWTLVPGMLLTSFGESGPKFEQFDEFLDETAAALKALADPTRLKILRLIRMFELDNTEIAAHLEVSRPTVSVHARTLREAGLITTRHEGRRAAHVLDEEAVRALFQKIRVLLDLPETNGS